MKEGKFGPMDPKIKTNNPKSLPTPYDIYKNLDEWHAIENAIADLVDNQDLVESTNRDYIVGYIIKCLDDKQLLSKK